MINLTLSIKQAELVKAALSAEIIKGQSTFLSDADVVNLGSINSSIVNQIRANKESLMSRIETAVEDYCDACDYSNYRDLTAEDIEYLASELQLGTAELEDSLNLELV